MNIDYGKIVRQLPMNITVKNTETKTLGSFRAVWDTGAVASAVSARVFEELALSYTGKAKVAGSTGSRTVYLTRVDIGFGSKYVFTDLSVTVLDLPPGIDALLGMDIITRGNFHIDNHTDTTDKTVLTFAAGVSQL